MFFERLGHFERKLKLHFLYDERERERDRVNHLFQKKKTRGLATFKYGPMESYMCAEATELIFFGHMMTVLNISSLSHVMAYF